MFYTFGFIMEKDFELIELFEIYQDLLTERQRELFKSHYLFDLSLQEIAEEENTSRQSVFDAVKKVRLKLVEFEKKLKIRDNNSKLLRLANDIKGENENVSQAILEIIGK